MITQHIKTGFRVVSNPEKEFGNLPRTSLEDVVACYMSLLILTALAAGIASSLLIFSQTLYFDIFFKSDVHYSEVANYSLVRGTSLVFMYLFLGTFLVFLITIILKQFFRKIRYTDFLKITCYSLSPMLLFGWAPFSIVSMLLWSIILLVLGIRMHRAKPVKKDSITNRERA